MASTGLGKQRWTLTLQLRQQYPSGLIERISAILRNSLEQGQTCRGIERKALPERLPAQLRIAGARPRRKDRQSVVSPHPAKQQHGKFGAAVGRISAGTMDNAPRPHIHPSRRTGAAGGPRQPQRQQ